MAKKKTAATDQNIEVVEGALSKTEQFIEDNQKILMIIMIAILAVVGIYMGYKKFYLAPLEEEALSQMFVAEQYFEKDSLTLALNGDGMYLGFLDIADEYSATRSGDLANYYAGVCYLKLGQFEDAIDYLEDFSGDDKMVNPIATGGIGDAHRELGDHEKAISYYLEAAEKGNNDFITPLYLMKAARTYEFLNDYQKALEIFERIEKEYPKSGEGRKIEKFITRAKLKIGSSQ